MEETKKEVVQEEQPKKATEVKKVSPLEEIDKDAFFNLLNEYFEKKQAQKQPIRDMLDEADRFSRAEAQLVKQPGEYPADPWERGLERSTKEFVKSIDRIKKMLDYEEYESGLFNQMNNGEKFERYRRFWANAYNLGGEKMAEVFIDRVRKEQKHFRLMDKYRIR